MKKLIIFLAFVGCAHKARSQQSIFVNPNLNCSVEKSKIAEHYLGKRNLKFTRFLYLGNKFLFGSGALAKTPVLSANLKVIGFKMHNYNWDILNLDKSDMLLPRDNSVLMIQLSLLLNQNKFSLKSTTPAELLAANFDGSVNDNFYHTMPVVKLEGNSKMPVLKTEGWDNMPVKHVNPINPQKNDAADKLH